MANAITTLEMVKDAAHITPANVKWDDVLTDWITVAGDAFERRYKKFLTAQAVTETYFDVSSGQLMALKHVPINSITSITTYDTEDAVTTPVVLIPGTDYRLQDSEGGLVKFSKLSAFVPVGLLEAMALTPMIWAKVVVVYNTGLVTVPMTIQRTAAEWLAHWYDQYGVNQEQKSDKIGDIANDFYDFTKWPQTVREQFAAYDTSADNLVGII